MITSLDQIADNVVAQKKKCTIAVAWAQDPNTLSAIERAVNKGIAEAILIGNTDEIIQHCGKLGIDHDKFTLCSSEDESAASAQAVAMTRTGKADIVMKGLVGTDKFLKAVMDKNQGIMKSDSVLTYVCALQIPAYHKLLFLTDPAVIPYPTLEQKTAMLKYAISMASKFGISEPKVALVSATEKESSHFPHIADYAKLKKMAAEGEFPDAVIDGPLDIFLACDRQSVEIKGVKTPVDGDADILLFPSLEASNPFYKGLMLFGGGELAGILRGTEKPVVVMSRSESEASKFYCIALACLLA